MSVRSDEEKWMAAFVGVMYKSPEMSSKDVPGLPITSGFDEALDQLAVSQSGSQPWIFVQMYSGERKYAILL